MGIPSSTVSEKPPAGDLANAVVSGSFTGTGQSPLFSCWGPFNVVLYGNAGPNGAMVGTVRLERSFDGGTTWVVCGVGGAGSQASYTLNGADISVVAAEPEKGVLYRLNCTAYTSGTINYRMSATGGAALSLGNASII
jgi:hypothetical protein